MHIREEKLPGARQLARTGQELSREAQVRLARLDLSRTRGRNAALTCRHFGISRETSYGWWRCFDPHDLHSLESRSHRPRHRRQPTWTPGWAVQVLRWRLFVLPPRSPKLHGVVERAQRTHTEQSYWVMNCSLEMEALNRELRE
jgi:hypothetical protein